MKIIDAHTHIFPDKISEKVSRSIGGFYGMPYFASASVKNLLAEGNAAGISHFLVCSAAVTPEQTPSITDFMAQVIKNHNCFTALASIHPDFPDFEAEIDRAVSLGLAGIKLHPDFQKFEIDDEKVFPLYRAIAKRGLPLLMHMGDKRYHASSPEKLAAVMKKFPDLTVIAAHFGGFQRWQEAHDQLAPSDRLWFDTSSSTMFVSRDYALSMFDKFGIDRFFFGTDFPLWNAAEEIERIKALGLSDSDHEKLFSGNFTRLFGLGSMNCSLNEAQKS